MNVTIPACMVVALNKHYNVAIVPPLLQILEVAAPDLILPIQAVVGHYHHNSFATATQRGYFAEQQYYVQSRNQVNQTVIPTFERTLLLFAVYLALSGLAYLHCNINKGLVFFFH